MQYTSKKLATLTLFSCLMALTSLPVSAQSVTANRCELGETCNVSNSTGLVYYPVTKNTGTTYTCQLKAEGDRTISVAIYDGGDFEFPTQNISADKNGTTTVIQGDFKGDNGQIKVRQTTSINADGSIMCRAGS